MDQTAPTDRVKVSRRQSNKDAKRKRILASAREAFRMNGFEATTMRQVASAAGIGTGTLFLYAETKEALLITVFKEELGPVFDKAFAKVPAGDLKTQLLYIFEPISRHHESDKEIARPFLREMLLIRQPERGELLSFTDEWNKRVADLVRQAQERGEIVPTLAPELLAMLAIDLFLAGLRRWMSDSVSKSVFDQTLEAGIGFLIAGAETRS